MQKSGLQPCLVSSAPGQCRTLARQLLLRTGLLSHLWPTFIALLTFLRRMHRLSVTGFIGDNCIYCATERGAEPGSHSSSTSGALQDLTEVNQRPVNGFPMPTSAPIKRQSIRGRQQINSDLPFMDCPPPPSLHCHRIIYGFYESRATTPWSMVLGGFLESINRRGIGLLIINYTGKWTNNYYRIKATTFSWILIQDHHPPPWTTENEWKMTSNWFPLNATGTRQLSSTAEEEGTSIVINDSIPICDECSLAGGVAVDLDSAVFRTRSDRTRIKRRRRGHGIESLQKFASIGN